jgi:hypothetical protein
MSRSRNTNIARMGKGCRGRHRASIYLEMSAPLFRNPGFGTEKSPYRDQSERGPFRPGR